MKKVLIVLFMFASLIMFKQANAQQLKFYYYPNNNVYYDVAHKQYIYSDNGNWTTVTTLPSGLRVVNTPRYIIYNPTPQVWVQNPIHLKKYKNNYPKGKAVGYKGTNPNKAIGKGTGKSKKH